MARPSLSRLRATVCVDHQDRRSLRGAAPYLGTDSPLSSEMTDTALDWFLADAERQGITHSEYERRYGVVLTRRNGRRGPAQRRIDAHEIAAGQMTDGDLATARMVERHRDDIDATRRACASVVPSAIRLVPSSSARSSEPRTPRLASLARTCARPSSRDGSPIAA